MVTVLDVERKWQLVEKCKRADIWVYGVIYHSSYGHTVHYVRERLGLVIVEVSITQERKTGNTLVLINALLIGGMGDKGIESRRSSYQ